jgi:serine phosphatase RsbU (regulator of sigma subunit)
VAASLIMATPSGAFSATRVLLIEDDDADALLVEELLIDAGEQFELVRAGSIRAAMEHLGTTQCALVDLGLPDAHDLSAVEALRRAAPDVALVVLTGHIERARGLAALAAGAQDYLVKGEVDGPTLARAIRYALERRGAETNAHRLIFAEHRQGENDRLARGLLPRLEVGGRGVETATRYQPGGRDALLGGDFFDALQLPDGTVRAVIGDVCGHGPAEAALGVALRIAWRTLVLAGADAEAVLAGVEQVLRHERDDPMGFATVCDLTIAPDGCSVAVRLHGHPTPLVVVPQVDWLPGARPAPPLGCMPYAPAAVHHVPLVRPWAMVLMTDGLHEARAGSGRLGTDAVAAIAAEVGGWTTDPAASLGALLQRVIDINGGDLEDDVALLWLGSVS